MLIRLPNRSWPLWLLATLLWIGHPILVFKYLIITQNLGWYPPEADSIAAPMMIELMFTLVGAPLWYLLCSKAFRPYPGAADLFVWNTKAWASSLVISAIFGGLTAVAALGGASDVRLFLEIRRSDFSESQFLGIYRALVSVGWIALWLSMRSCFIVKKSNQALSDLRR